MIEFRTAIETFASGYTVGRSLGRPAEVARFGSILVMRDALPERPDEPPQAGAELRTEEWIVAETAPAEAQATIDAHRRGRYGVAVAVRTEAEARRGVLAWKALGYRYRGAEAFFVHSLEALPEPKSFRIEAADSIEAASALARAARRRIVPVPPVEGGPMRAYVAWDGATPIGWAVSTRCPEAAWCSNVFTLPAYRRRGIGAGVMGALLRGDRAAGAPASVLLASAAGGRLYPRVGYLRIGSLLLFSPVRPLGG